MVVGRRRRIVIEVSRTFAAYLRTIYNLQEDGVPVLRARLCERLGQAGPTVTQTVNRLASSGLLAVDGASPLALSQTGLDAAIVVTRRHRLAERLMTDVLDLPTQLAHAEAARWEYSMGPDVERAIVNQLDDPTLSPWGIPIPGLDQLGVEARTLAPATRLKDLPRTKRPVIATVRSVSEDTQDDRERLTELINAGIIPGAQISITATADSIEVRGLNTIVLSPRRSHSIQIDLSPTAATS